MKPIFKVVLFAFVLSAVSCIGGKSSKRGCPANDANLGAERVMAGEGSKKPSKFKVKDMNKSFNQR